MVSSDPTQDPLVDETSQDPLGPEKPGKLRAQIRKLRRRFRPPRRLYPTRAGMFLLAAPIVLGVAAVNASNNLLSILLALSLALIILSGFLSEANLAGLSVSSMASSAARVGEPARLVLRLANERSRWKTRTRFGVRVAEMRRRREPPSPRLDVTIPIIEGGGITTIATRTFERRGVKRLASCELTTTFPFGLFRKARDVSLDAEIVVRPKRVEVPEALLDPRALSADGRSARERGFGLDVYGLRERNDWDPITRVHALRSAALGREVVIETEATTKPIAWLGVANLEGAGREAFERTLEIAAATIEQWSELGYAVGLEVAEQVFPPGAATEELLLDALSLLGLEASRPNHASEAVVWLVPVGARIELDPESTRVVLVQADGQLEIPGASR